MGIDIHHPGVEASTYETATKENAGCLAQTTGPWTIVGDLSDVYGDPREGSLCL